MKPHCILIPLDNRINRRITFAFYYIAHGQSDFPLHYRYDTQTLRVDFLSPRSSCGADGSRANDCAPY